MRKIVAVVTPVLLAGCGIPPAVSVGSYVVDGVVMATTGKNVRDHAISTAAQQDCNMFHVVEGGNICQDYEPNDRVRIGLLGLEDNERVFTTTSDGRAILVAADGPATERVLTSAPNGRDVMVAVEDTPNYVFESAVANDNSDGDVTEPAPQLALEAAEDEELAAVDRLSLPNLAPHDRVPSPQLSHAAAQ